MEFEVCMNEGEDLELGNEIAEKLMKSFELRKDQLVIIFSIQLPALFFIIFLPIQLEGSYFEILNTSST
jgi:hypothetical protein